MAQHKLAIAAPGTGIDGVAASADATSLSGAEMWVIIGANATRTQVIEHLRNALAYAQASKNAFPFA